MGSDISDSVYREAEAKLRILLAATEAPTLRVGDLKQQRRGGASKSLDHLYTELENNQDDLDRTMLGTPRREPMFVKLPPKQPNNSVRRQLFSNSQPPGGRMRGRHNSWHNLTETNLDNEGDSHEQHRHDMRRHQSASASYLNLHQAPRPPSPSSMSPAVKELIQRQEIYIEQLEREAAFCKEQLSTILTQVKDVLIANSNEDQAKKEEIVNLIKNIETEVKTVPVMKSSKIPEDTKDVKLKVESQNEDPEAVKKLREELENLRLRESEAAEQVQRSIKVAEQIKQQKSEAEFEVGQLSGQVERQQARIRSLIEDQVNKVEEERTAIEKRYKDLLDQGRDDLQKIQQENVRLSSLLEKSSRSESEAKRLLEEKDRILSKVKEEMDRRVGELQLEIVEFSSAKQSLDREVNKMRLRLEKEKSDNNMEVERLQSEIGAVRGRLKFAEENLVDQRGQNLQMVEAVASLETELINEKHRRENAEKRKIEEVSKIKSERNEEIEKIRTEKISKEKRLKKENEQLEDLIRRQRSIISELKCQCREVTDKFEDSYNSWLKEKHSMRSEVAELKNSMLELGDQVKILENQNVEHVKLHQNLLGQINYLEDCSKSPTKQQSSSKLNSSHNNDHKIKGTTRKRVSAITIERAGKVKHLVSSVN